jgi:hypothetical protein
MRQNIHIRMSVLAAYLAVTTLSRAEPLGKNAAQLIASKYISTPKLQLKEALTHATRVNFSQIIIFYIQTFATFASA